LRNNCLSADYADYPDYTEKKDFNPAKRKGIGYSMDNSAHGDVTKGGGEFLRRTYLMAMARGKRTFKKKIGLRGKFTLAAKFSIIRIFGYPTTKRSTITG
jgi:hypothetical protein